MYIYYNRVYMGVTGVNGCQRVLRVSRMSRVSQAALPWSPASVRRVWTKALAKGLSPEEALRSLSRAEARTLARDSVSQQEMLG